MPGNRRLTVLWNADGAPRAAGVRKHGTAAKAVDKYGGSVPLVEQQGAWMVSLPPATGSDPRDPAGYFYIGGDPLIVVEEGVPAGAPVDPPIVGGAAQRSFEIAANPADQTVASGAAAEFFLATQGVSGAPIQLQVVEWSTQADPSAHDPASLPLAVNLPTTVQPGPDRDGAHRNGRRPARHLLPDGGSVDPDRLAQG